MRRDFMIKTITYVIREAVAEMKSSAIEAVIAEIALPSLLQRANSPVNKLQTIKKMLTKKKANMNRLK